MFLRYCREEGSQPGSSSLLKLSNCGVVPRVQLCRDLHFLECRACISRRFVKSCQGVAVSRVSGFQLNQFFFELNRLWQILELVIGVDQALQVLPVLVVVALRGGFQYRTSFLLVMIPYKGEGIHPEGNAIFWIDINC